MATLQRAFLIAPILPRTLMHPGLAQVRHKGKQANTKSKKSRKDMRREVMKDFMKRQEYQKLMTNASLKAAKMGEPLDPEMLNPARKREPTLKTTKEKESEFLLVKEWSRFTMTEHTQQMKSLRDMVASREKAMKELKKLSPSLYTRALELNEQLFPFSCVGPTATPPLEGYSPPEPEE